MKFLIMLFSPTSFYFLYITCRYSPQHSVLEHLQSLFLSLSGSSSRITSVYANEYFTIVILNAFHGRNNKPVGTAVKVKTFVREVLG
jgi:hypothetical protein